ncbi:thioesterase II family protein [Salinarimonas rosea]|uniref:thioesterase II family protein n=1 Tax=Salinarimonas rosea TaxID=552063 RepID=UPI0004240ED0|nr:alpha/beta fold hydrolase [Salinarimonas rosea]
MSGADAAPVRLVRIGAAGSTRLVACPHAGGSPASFAGWRRALPADVSLEVPCLPGRGPAAAYPADLAAIAAGVTAALSADAGTPVLLFGASFGALLADAVAGALLARADAPPLLGVALAARPAPHRPRATPPLAHLPAREMIAGLAARYGTPRDAPADLAHLVAEGLRHDLALDEAHVHRPARPRATTLLPLAGRDDPTPADDVAAWSALYARTRPLVRIDGGHFFALERPRETVAAVLGLCERGG